MATLLFVDFEINDRRLAAVEGAERFRAAIGALMLGFQFVIHIGIETVEMVCAILLRDKRANLQSLGVFQLNYSPFERRILVVADHTLHGTGLLVVRIFLLSL